MKQWLNWWKWWISPALQDFGGSGETSKRSDPPSPERAIPQALKGRSPISAFTLIELLVIISIIGLLFTLGLAAYNNFNRRQLVDQATQELENNLRLAQSKAMAGQKPEGCTGTLLGYRVENLVSPEGDSYYTISAACSQSVVIGTYTLSTGLSLTGPGSVLFKVLGQGTDVDQTATFNVSGFGKTNEVKVGVAGEIGR